jgi:RNA polymerase sigma-70 factor (ECF subfamily)
MAIDLDREDDDAIAGVLDGDSGAYRTLIDRYGARLIAYCRARVRSQEEAEDAAQEIFIRAFKALPRFRRGESFPAWLFTIAGNYLRSRFRSFFFERRRVERAGIDMMAGNPEAGMKGFGDPVAETEKALEAEHLHEAIASLKPDMRTVIEYFYFAELSVIDTAKVLGIGEEAVKTRLFRARKLLRRYLENQQPGTAPGSNVRR